MAQNIFLINIEAPEIRIAEVRDKILFDLNIERSGRLLGDVFRGVVADIVPGMDAAFVNIGLARNALMYAGDVMQAIDPLSRDRVRPIQDLLSVGDQITVQVVRPPVGTKGARITGKISLSGRFVVMTQSSENVGVSKRITDDKERSRLRRIADKLRPFDKGVIMRSEALGASETDISNDINWLEQQMQTIVERAKTKSAPASVHRELGLLGRLVRDRLNDSVRQVLVDSREEYEILAELAQKITPTFADRIYFYQDSLPLFERYNLTEDFANANQRRVPLPHGGTLIIDENEAMCTIDVNTAHFTGKNRLADTIVTTNLEAAQEACRQLRLRDIGGIIVIDFIDMMRNRDRVKVLSALENSVNEDRTRTRIVQVSPSGLVELTRQRESVSLQQLRKKSCPSCHGDGVVRSPTTISIEARRQLRMMALQNEVRQATVTLFPEAACAMLENDERWMRDLEKATGLQIALRADAAYHLEAIDIQPGQLAEIPSILKVGVQMDISPHAGLYPARMSHYLLHQGMLVELEDFSFDSRETSNIPHPAIIEITESTQISCRAKVVAFHEE